jgi:hypothetical protein
MRARGAVWGGATLAIVVIAVAAWLVAEPEAPTAATTPFAVRGLLPASDELVVHAVGDVNLDPAELRVADPWRGVRSLFRSDGLTIVNLECAAGVGGVRQIKQYTFRCDPARYAAMRDAGVEVANQANNHSEDFGPDAMLDGRLRLERAGIAATGVGRNVVEANEASRFKVGFRDIGVLGFSAVVPRASWLADADRPGLANGYDIPSMTAAVHEALERSEVVIAVVHWGEELEPTPDDTQVARAHALIDAGAAMVFASHPHVLQPLEIYRGRPIFYSLGNFVWPSYGPTAIAEVRITAHGRIHACLLPVAIDGGRPRLTGATRC